MEFYFLAAFLLLCSTLNNVPVVEAYWPNSGIVNVAQYQTFGVACGAGQALTINFARYFSANDWNCGGDVTNQMRALCPGSKCSFIQVTNSVLGGDPCPGQLKSLHIDYYCN